MKLATGFFAVAVATAAAIYFGISAFAPAGAAAPVAPRSATPTAAEFARDLAGTANQYGSEHSAAERLTHTHCVEAAAGRYMCSFAVVHEDGSSECHLIQARWTPDAESTITVTLAGRVARCGSLRQALDSMS